MKRKRVEIVRCLCAAALLPVAADVLARQAVSAPSGTHSGEAWAFPVDTSRNIAPLALPPLPGVEAQEASIPDIPYTFFWSLQDGVNVRSRAYVRQQRVSEHSTGLLGGAAQPRIRTPQSRWLATPAGGGWAFDVRHWSTRLDTGPKVQLGSSEIAPPEWEESIRLGGISLSQSFLAESEASSQWKYSVAFGAVDHSSAGPGDLEFGPTAGSLALAYDYNPALSFESQSEVGAGFVMSGLSGEYDLGALGRWHSGFARSGSGTDQGWRYRARADFDVASDVSLGWMGERYTDGFMDIRRYASGAGATAGGRQRLSASWDTGQWGKWSGSVESVHSRQGVQQRRFGLNQQFWYSPNLRIGIHAEREVVAGDYDIGLRFSFPLY